MQVILPTPILMDNRGALYMASNMLTQNNSKLVHLTEHPIRAFANKGVRKLEYIGTKHHIAHITTKPLQIAKHSRTNFASLLLLDQES